MNINCPSLNGRSTVKYSIDVSGSDTKISIRETTGAANTNGNWVKLSDIKAILDREKSFSSTVLYPLLTRNNAGFIMAVLLNEGVIEKEGKRYKLTGTEIGIPERKIPVPERAA